MTTIIALGAAVIALAALVLFVPLTAGAILCISRIARGRRTPPPDDPAWLSDAGMDEWVRRYQRRQRR